MARNYYALPTDVIRKFDPTLSAADIGSGALGEGGVEDIRARLDEVESELERTTEHAWRETRVGHGTESYEYHGSSFRRYQNGVKVYLDHRHVLPLDAVAGDVLAVRESRDSWKDVLGNANVDYELDNELGILHVWGIRRYVWHGPHDDRAVRLSYRYGSLGGDRNRGGETTTTESLANDGASVAVANAARLPPDGVMLVGGKEYVRASADPATDTVTLHDRGIRGTASDTHTTDTTIHYAPMSVRSGVAAKAAVELVLYDDHVENLMETRESPHYQDKIDAWEAEWDRLLAKESEVRSV